MIQSHNIMSILQTTSSNMILQQQQQQQQRTKMKTTAVVSFQELVRVNVTLHINDYADDEVESCWFTSTEYNAIRNRIFMTLDTVKLLSSPTNSNLCSNSSSNSNNSTSSSSSSSVCIRGLEHYVSSCFGEQQPQGLKKSTRIRRRRNAISAVLHEQDRQQYEIAISTSMFFYDDVKIRDASRNITRISEDIASVMGQFDHIAACTDDGNNTVVLLRQ
mmetsp:Transcript_56284/g.60938  ORF Transcript_56284/g.60938 Transcript_56284/m.60938 type:complete len:218 (-) Transcript_56284:201-854(-)